MLIIVIGLTLYKLHFLPLHFLSEAAGEDSSDVDAQLSQIDLEKLERNYEFEDRIARMKDELAGKQEIKQRQPSEAQIFHPDIRNLPHDDVRARNDLEPTEIAE